MCDVSKCAVSVGLQHRLSGFSCCCCCKLVDWTWLSKYKKGHLPNCSLWTLYRLQWQQQLQLNVLHHI